MSYANKPNRPDSRDTARLRDEYEHKARQFRETTDPASKAKLKDDKQKAFDRVVSQMNGERAESLAATHKVLVGMGKMKTEAQMKEERERREAGRDQRVKQEGR